MLAEKVRQLDMEQRNGQSEQDVSEFHGHYINLGERPRSSHRANFLGVAAKSLGFCDVLEFKVHGLPRNSCQLILKSSSNCRGLTSNSRASTRSSRPYLKPSRALMINWPAPVSGWNTPAPPSKRQRLLNASTNKRSNL